MSWRVARSLDVLLGQINTTFPTRDKASDGGIGDAAHASRASDHNPWFGPAADGLMLVTARDYTHDPSVGLDMHVLTDQLAASRDPRIKYMIFDGWILDSRPEFSPWRWIPYHGADLHSHHLHLSVVANLGLCDETSPWHVPMLQAGPAEPPQPPPDGPLPDVQVGSRVLSLETPYLRGTDVLKLQRVLNRWYPTLLAPLDEDGVYGPNTASRVRYLQSRAGILVDGEAGPQTFGVLHML